MTSGVEHTEGTTNEEPALEQSMLHVGEDHSVAEVNHGVTAPPLARSASNVSQSQTQTYTPSRSSTLKKKSSIKRAGSIGRTASRRSSYAGSLRSVKVVEGVAREEPQNNSAFFCPVPTMGNPTELLADRFQCELSTTSCLWHLLTQLQHGEKS